MILTTVFKAAIRRPSDGQRMSRILGAVLCTILISSTAATAVEILRPGDDIVCIDWQYPPVGT